MIRSRRTAQFGGMGNPAFLAVSIRFLAISIPLVIRGSAGCHPDRPAGLAATERRGGPRVVFEPDATPLPEIPLPCDLATRLDPSSPTGRRINVSLDAVTQYERETREKYNRLDGFSTFGPITVQFDARLDLADLHARHNDNDDFRDDAVYLLNVDPGCERFGEEIAVDLGRGRYPLTLYRHTRRIPDPAAPGGYRLDEGSNLLFEFDPRGEYNNMIYEERTEDRNGDGVLDPGEDLDGDGELDEANFIDPHACAGLDATSVAYDRCVADNLMTWYERETNTLILRPVWPMEQQCVHAVVLTKRLRGAGGQPVESPFPAVNHANQTEALRPLPSLLPRYDLDVSDIAFAWTFTTGSMTRVLEALRAGLYGHGAFARLAEEFPVETFRVWTRGELADDSPSPEARLTPGACTGEALVHLWAKGIDEWDPNMCSLGADNSTVGGAVGGTFAAPNFLVDKDGIGDEHYPADDDETFDVDVVSGTATYGRTTVTWWCTLPRELDTSCAPGNPEGAPFCKPFPVILYAHGYGSSRVEITSHQGRTNAFGYAMCAMDSYGHGLNRMLQDPLAAIPFSRIGSELEDLGVPALKEMILRGRDRDLNHDGLADPGADMWTADLFHTRDMLQQSVVEYQQLVRILRSMDGLHRDAAGNLLGDFDGDGQVDLGGPDNTIAMWGISLGGIYAGILAGAEPSLDAVSPNAGAAGLADVAARSWQGGVPEAVILPILGPVIAGCLPTDAHQQPLPPGTEGDRDCLTGDGGSFEGGVLRLFFYLNDTAKLKQLEFAEVEGVAPGDRVRLENLDNGEVRETRVDARGRFRTAVAADALTAMERRPLLGLHGEDYGPVTIEDTPRFGDRLRITIFDGDSDTPKAVVDTFGRTLEFQGSGYPAGAPLVALQQGLGHDRNTPDFRRFMALSHTALAQADPGVWAAHYFMDPIDTSYDPYAPESRMHVLAMPTAGDQNVPVNTGIAMARAAGLLGSWRRDPDRYGPEHGWREIFAPDPRYGQSIDQMLLDRYVVEADGRFQRYADNPVNPNIIYDVDNVSDGSALFSCGPSDWSASSGESGCPDEIRGQEIFFPVPHPAPGNALRHSIPAADGAHHAVRIPLLRPAGQHGIYNAQAFRVFDADAFMVNFTTRFLGTRGRAVDHAPGCDCVASRPFRITVDGEQTYSSLQGERQCVVGQDYRVCSVACAEAWGMRTPEVTACEPE
jgi:hypothetical protein